MGDAAILLAYGAKSDHWIAEAENLLSDRNRYREMSPKGREQAKELMQRQGKEIDRLIAFLSSLRFPTGPRLFFDGLPRSVQAARRVEPA